VWGERRLFLVIGIYVGVFEDLVCLQLTTAPTAEIAAVIAAATEMRTVNTAKQHPDSYCNWKMEWQIRK
jgi:hypothetical protein